MATKVRVNLANAQELFELPGLDAAQVAAIVIVRFRSEHGPIKDADQLATILSGYPPTGMLRESATTPPRGAWSLASEWARESGVRRPAPARPSPPRPARRDP